MMRYQFILIFIQALPFLYVLLIVVGIVGFLVMYCLKKVNLVKIIKE